MVSEQLWRSGGSVASNLSPWMCTTEQGWKGNHHLKIASIQCFNWKTWKLFLFRIPSQIESRGSDLQTDNWVGRMLSRPKHLKLLKRRFCRASGRKTAINNVRQLHFTLPFFLQQADSLFGNYESKSQWSIWQKNCIAFFFLSPEPTIAGVMPDFCITSEGDARSAKVRCLLWLPAYGPTVHQETVLVFNGCAQVCKQSLFAQDTRHDDSVVNWLRNIVNKKYLMCWWTKKKNPDRNHPNLQQWKFGIH